MKSLLLPWTGLPELVRHTLGTFETLLGDNMMRLVLAIVSVIVFWHIYVPIHELLHVAACLMGGGTVETLALKPQYGGTILQHVFPFIVSESDYAGQLTGFTTPNDFVYAFVDFLPYSLSLFGVALMEWVRRGKRLWAFGPAVVLTYVPLMSITGDYYEAVSLVTTRIAQAWDASLPTGVLISDDLFASIGQLSKAGRLSGPVVLLLVTGVAAAAWLALVTLSLQRLVAERMFGELTLGDVDPIPEGAAQPG
ncbi:MAG: hypothetical protein QNK37_30650 [Acidobacteriota bacterium]|nr:hypothetical protein [Acidobacteriota bacterium]